MTDDTAACEGNARRWTRAGVIVAPGTLAPGTLDTLISAVEGESVDPTEAVQNIEDYAVDNCDVEVEG